MNVKTKRLIRGTLLVFLASMVLNGCSGGQPNGTSNDTSKGNATPFAGKKITVFMANVPWTEMIRSMLPEFEKKTGMQVDVQSSVEDQLTQKLTVQFTSNSPSPDVFMHRPLQEGKLFAKNGWVDALDNYVNKDPNYDFKDFSKSSISSTTVDGKLTAIPITVSQEVLYYRKDLLQNAGLSVPKTLDELEAAAKQLNDPKNEVFGFVGRGQAQALVTQVSSFVFSEGGDFMNGDKATVNTPEALKGFSRYAKMLREYGPPGVLNMSWPQAMGIFTQGKAVFYADDNALFSNTLDKEKSKIADKVGFAVFPAGQAGSRTYNDTVWSLALNKQSVNKDAAWAFIQWASSKEVVLKTQQKGNPGARDSVWNTPEGTSGFPPDMVQVVKESSKTGVGYDRPLVINVGEARDIVGEIVVKGILGQDMKAAADKANQAFQAIIDKEKGK